MNMATACADRTMLQGAWGTNELAHLNVPIVVLDGVQPEVILDGLCNCIMPGVVGLALQRKPQKEAVAGFTRPLLCVLFFQLRGVLQAVLLLGTDCLQVQVAQLR